MSSRFGNPDLSFANYVKSDEEAEGPRMTPAAKISEPALEYVKKFWHVPSAQVGDYILMSPNGPGKIMSAADFEKTYVKRSA